MIDSLDSILMLYSYSGFPEHSWVIFERSSSTELQVNKSHEVSITRRRVDGQTTADPLTGGNASLSLHEILETEEVQVETPVENDQVKGSVPKLKSGFNRSITEDRAARNLRVKGNTMSGLSIVLTLMSILVAFRQVSPLVYKASATESTAPPSISIITIMGLVGDNCRPCRDAASTQDGHRGGLAGSWWRVWAKVCAHCSRPIISQIYRAIHW
jgi:nickel/cobalt transporter (NiCoT) family protein